jgi:O-antigen/teichoic acid export membrane protein
MLMTIPLFLIVSDFGYSAAAAGMMSKAVAHEDYEDALTSLHTALAVVGSIALAMILGAVALAIALMPNAHLIRPFAGLSSADMATVARMAPFLLAYVAVSLMSGLVNAVYRVNGHYPVGVMIFETGRLIEQAAVMIVAITGGSLTLGAIVMLGSRITFTSLSSAVMWRQTPWATLSFSHVSRRRLSELTVPAIGAMFIPICIIAGMQGITFAVGLFLSPASAGAFATVRVLYRMVVQIIGTLTRASVPDFAIAFARKDVIAQTKIARLTLFALFAGATLGTCAILVLGPWFVHAWTRGKSICPFTSISSSPPIPSSAVYGMACQICSRALTCIRAIFSSYLSGICSLSRCSLSPWEAMASLPLPLRWRS